MANSLLCPVTALYDYIATTKAGMSQPLFLHPFTGLPITQNFIRTTLSKINCMMGFHSNYFSFQAFRRSGATLAFDNNATLQHIQAHGGWRSSAVWSYLTNAQTGVVPQTFQSIVS